MTTKSQGYWDMKTACFSSYPSSIFSSMQSMQPGIIRNQPASNMRQLPHISYHVELEERYPVCQSCPSILCLLGVRLDPYRPSYPSVDCQDSELSCIPSRLP